MPGIEDAIWRFDLDARLNAYGTLFLFLPIVVGTYWLLRKNDHRLLWLAVASTVFYSFWDWRFTPLLLFSVFLDYWLALKAAGGNKGWMWTSVIVNLGLLAAFKYLVFTVITINSMADWFGSSGGLAIPNIILPLGISFYAFQTMSYTIDAYRGTITPTRDFVKFAAYVMLFPQLVAGPIVRYSELGDQLGTRRIFQVGEFSAGIERLSLGLVKKVLVADQIAIRIDGAWAGADPLSSTGALVAILGFTVQIYIDISAYADMAIGTGHLLGYKFPENFNRPFTARNPQEFWSRNHMTLSRFIRDYLYIPLGGNRGSRAVQVRTLVIAFGLGGLWHGATWLFLIWGLCHGSALAAYRFRGKTWDSLPSWGQQASWMGFHVATMTFFRAGDLETFQRIWGALVSGSAGWSPTPTLLALIGGSYLTALTPLGGTGRRFPPWLRTSAVGFLFGAAVFIMNKANPPFEYFQF